MGNFEKITGITNNSIKLGKKKSDGTPLEKNTLTSTGNSVETEVLQTSDGKLVLGQDFENHPSIEKNVDDHLREIDLNKTDNFQISGQVNESTEIDTPVVENGAGRKVLIDISKLDYSERNKAFPKLGEEHVEPETNISLKAPRTSGTIALKEEVDYLEDNKIADLLYQPCDLQSFIIRGNTTTGNIVNNNTANLYMEAGSEFNGSMTFVWSYSSEFTKYVKYQFIDTVTITQSNNSQEGSQGPWTPASATNNISKSLVILPNRRTRAISGNSTNYNMLREITKEGLKFKPASGLGNISFTLSVTDKGSGSLDPHKSTRNATLQFNNAIYYGSFIETANFYDIMDSAVLSGGDVNKRIDNSRNFTFSTNAVNDKYIYVIIPNNLGNSATFTVGGFAGGFIKITGNYSYTNSYGYTESRGYSVWKSDNINLGNTRVSVSIS